MSNNTRIAKNTLMLYFRHILILLVGLYTVRVKLDILGVEDFGIYNIVGGIVVIFSFLNNVMTNTTQRFLSFSLGENNKEKARDVFSASVIVHLLIALFVILLAETIGLFIFYKLLNLPPHRLDAAFIVYQLSVLTTVIRILTIPYSASIIAHEKMSFYAILGFIEVILKLGVVFLLLIIFYDKLIIYSWLIFFLYVLTLLLHILYCLKYFEMSRFRLCKDKNIYKQISSFSGWTIISNFSNLLERYGINVIINMFYGVILNAAMGIANQVNSTIATFVTSFQTAVKPQLIKYYAANDTENFLKLIFRSAKISFYLLLFFVLPFYLNADFVLLLWLKNVPDYAVILTQLLLLASLEYSVLNILLTAIHAIGKIKKYELISSGVIITNLPLSYFLLSLNFNPIWTLIIKILLLGIIILMQIIYLNKLIKFPIRIFLIEVILPIILITVISSGITYSVFNLFFNWTRLILTCIVSTVSIIGLVLLFGINKQEKYALINYIKNKININNKG